MSQETAEDRPRGISVDGGGGSWWRAALPLGIGALLTVAARMQPERVEEIYSRGLYPKIGALLQGLAQRWTALLSGVNGDLSARRPSLSEALIGVAVGVLLVALVRAARHGWGALARRLLWTAGSAYLAFLLCWGLNHARLPLGVALDLPVQEVSAEDLGNVALELERDLSQLLRKEEKDRSEVEPADGLAVGRAALSAWGEALRRDPRLGWQPEPTLCAPALSGALVKSGISGIFSPFSQEAHVACGLPESDLAFAACHEIAHVQGWAREDEANYLAWRVASRSDSTVLRKAALVLALVHVHRALQRADPERQRQLALSMDVRVVVLLQKRSAFWAIHRSEAAARTVGAVNDRYLKSQGHAAGIASYGRMVDLLVAELR